MLIASAVTGTARTLCLISAVTIVCLVGLVSCSSPRPSVRTKPADVEEAWPAAHVSWQETRVLPAAWAEAKQFWRPVSLDKLQVALPQVDRAEFVERDEFCETCHETYVRSFASNVHHQQGCESCHGAASRHLANRGTESDSVLSFRAPDTGSSTGRILQAAERSEICLQCHEDPERNPNSPCGPGGMWRTSVHAHKQVSCTDCHQAHYDVPPGTPPVDSLTRLGPGQVPPEPTVRPVSHQALPSTETLPPTEALPSAETLAPTAAESPRGKSHSLNAVEPDDCYACHENTRRMEQIVHPHQIGVPFDFECTKCHSEVPRERPRKWPTILRNSTARLATILTEMSWQPRARTCASNAMTMHT